MQVKISKPIWTRGCGGSAWRSCSYDVAIVNFLTISLLSFPITISVKVSFNRRRLEPQFHQIFVIFFQLFSKLFNYHYVNSFHVALCGLTALLI